MRGRARARVVGMVVAGVGLLALGWSLPGALGKQAPKIGAGYSFFETLSGTRFDFSKQPIPAGFFGTGSDVVRGVVKLRGIPIRRFQRVDVGTTDTIVRRRAAVGAAKTTVPIELVALSLVSGSPLRVTYAGGKVELWDLRLQLSPLKKSIGSMIVTGGDTRAGTFETSLTVWPLFTFIRRADGEQRTLDLGQLGAAGKGVKLTGKGRWASQPPPGALDYRLARGFWPRAFAQRAIAAVQWVRQPRDAVAPEFKVFVPPVIEVVAGTTAAMQVTYESTWPYWLDLAVRASSPGIGVTILGVAPRVLVGPRQSITHELIVQVAAGTPSADYPFSVKASFGTKETALGIVRVKTSAVPPPPPPPPPGPPPPGGDTRKLTVDARGGVTVTSSPAGITCPGDCSEDYQKDIQVTLIASTPGVVWTGCPLPLLDRCFVNMDTDRTVIAEPPPRLVIRDG